MKTLNRVLGVVFLTLASLLNLAAVESNPAQPGPVAGPGLTWVLATDAAMRATADHSRIGSVIDRAEADYARVAAALPDSSTASLGRIGAETVAVAQLQMLSVLLARWEELRGGDPARWTTRAATWRKRLAGQLGEGGQVSFDPTDGFDTVFWPLITGAVEREVAFAVVDQWMEAQRDAPVAALAPPELAYWAAQGCERYGRRDGAAAVLETADDLRGNTAAEQALWRQLTAGQRGRIVPPATPFPGHPPRVPYWAFRPWAWEDNVNTAESTLGLIQGYLDHDIPVGTVIVDSPWSTAYNDFNWDRQRYPDPKAMIDKLHADGVKVVMWLTGSVNRSSKDTPLQTDAAFDEVAAKGYAVDDGRVVSWWKGDGRLVDFTHPEAVAWWAQRFDQVAALGIDGWKVDVSDDYVPDEVNTFLGRMARAQWRQYYYAAVHDVALNRNPASAIIARPFSHQGGFAAPVSKVTIGWAGDFSGDWEGMRQQVRDLYISARAGYATLYYEVGGFQHHVPDKEQLIRHAQLGAFFPVMSNGGANGGLTGHLPWYHDEETVAIYRRFAQWHTALAPYFFGLAIESYLNGRPLLREVDADHWLHQIGEEILVAPVFAAATSREIPARGDRTWLDWWTLLPVAADGPATVEVPMARYPVYVRAGAVIPLDLRAGLADWGLPAGEHGFALWIVPGKARRAVVQLPAGEGIEAISVGVTVDVAAHEIVVEGGRVPALDLVVSTPTRPARVEGADAWHYDAAANRLFITLGEGGGRVMLHGK